MTRKIVVDVVGDASKFNKTLDAASGKTKGFGSVVTGIGLGVGVKAFDLVTDAVGSFIGQLGNAADAYRNDQVSQTNLANTLKNTVKGWNGSTAAIESYASAQARLGFEDDDIRASISQLIGVTHNQAEAMKLNSLAQDLARAKGLDLATATDIVTKAAQGNGKALKGLGIDISNAKTAADFLDATQRNVKGSAEAWAQTSDGKLAVANVKQSEAWEKIGGVVDKIATVVIPIAADAFSTIADVISNVAIAVEPLITQLVTQLSPIIQSITKWVNAELVPAFNQVVKAVGPIVATIANNLIPIFKTVINIVSTVVGWFASKIPGAIHTLTPIIKTLGSVFSTIFGGIGSIVSSVASTVSSVFQGLGLIVQRVWDGIGKTVRGAINAVIGAVNGIIRGINSVQLHIHIDPPIGPSIGFDWNGMRLGYLPYLHQGGIVPGPDGSDVLTVLQAGERVLPRSEANGSPTINIYIDGSVYGDLDQLAKDLAFRLRTVGV